MKTALRRLFNYWLPPGTTLATLNPLVDLAVKINASCTEVATAETAHP